MFNHLALDDFAQGFAGDASGEELLKAMQAGSITGRETANLALTMEPLKPESLERTLKNLEFRTQDIKMFNSIPKMVAYNTVEEFVQLYSFGQERGGFYSEGELSEVEDSQYIRRAELVKYMQVTGSVTMQAQMVKSFVQAMTQEVENKMKWILRLANRNLAFADADVVPDQFNGLYRQHMSIGSGGGLQYFWATRKEYFNSDVVVDLRGKSLKQADVEKGAIIVDDHYGTPTDLYAPPKVNSALSIDYYQQQRILQDAKGGSVGTFGTVVKAISTSIGDVALNGDKFLKSGNSKTSATPTDPKAPPAPTVSTVALAADTNSKYVTAVDNPSSLNVFYAVAAVGKYGESNLTINSTAIVWATGQAVDITLAEVAGTYPTLGYNIYVTKPTAAGTPTGLEFFPLFKVPKASVVAGFDGGAANKVRDLGYFMPDTEQALLTQWNDEVVSFKQLAPISKLDLAVISMSRQFICFLFGTPNLYAPKKMIRYINCAKKYVA